MKRQVEIFTAGCPVCEPLVEMVRDTASDDCEIILYNLSDPGEQAKGMAKMKTYGIKTLPALVFEGQPIGLSTEAAVTVEDLTRAGISKN